MIPALGDLELLFGALAGNAIDQAMFVIEPARPPSAPLLAQRLRLTDAAKGRAAHVFHEGEQPVEQLGIAVVMPPEVVPGPGTEGDLHRVSTASEPLPASNSAMLSLSRCALAGLRRRYSVSIMLSYSLWAI